MEKMPKKTLNDTGIIYSFTLEKLYDIMEQDAEIAAKTAIAAIEIALCGECETDDKTTNLILVEEKRLAKSNIAKYERGKAEAKRTKAVENGAAYGNVL